MFFIYFLLNSAKSAAIAVDLGSYFTKSSIFNNTNSPKIAENLESKRITPSFIAFRIKEGMNTKKKTQLEPEEVEDAIPSIGNKALSLMERRPFMGAGYFTYNCDLEDEKIQEFSKKMVTNSSITRFSYEDTLALYMQMYANFVIPGQETKRVAVIVPATYTMSQRKIIENAVRNAKLQYGGIIDDNEAVFTYYAVERIRFFADKPQTVLFIDIGASSIKSYAARFELVKEKGKPTAHVNVTKLSYSISNKEGGAFVTQRIMDYFIDKLKLKKLSDSEKRRIFTACEQIKKSLSLSNVHKTQQFVEDIAGKDEIQLVMSDDDLIPLIKPLLKEMVNVAEEVFGDLDIDDIQLLGGSSRLIGVPVVLQRKFNVTARSNLNQEETVAIGGGYALQYRLGLSRLSQIQWDNLYPVLSLTIENAGTSQKICTRGGECKNSVTLDNVKDSFLLKYDPSELPLPIKNQIIKYNVTDSELPLNIQFLHSPTRIAYASQCNGTNCSTAFLTNSLINHEPSPAFSTILKMEAKRKAVAHARGNLESFTAHLLDELEYNNTVRYFMSDSQRFSIHKAAEKVNTWLAEYANSVANETTFKTHYSELNSYIQPVYQRIKENKTIEYALSALQKEIQYSLMASLLEWPVNKTWINKTTLDDFRDLINESMMLVDKVHKYKNEVNPWDPFPISSTNLTDMAHKLYKEYIRIDSIPKPIVKEKKKGGFWDSLKNFFGFGKKKDSKVNETSTTKTTNTEKKKSDKTKSQNPTTTPTPPPTTQIPNPQQSPQQQQPTTIPQPEKSDDSSNSTEL